ncbi:FG-GAP repeat domain-containing protein [Streptomyces sp. NPDC001678]|uniref:FG-GAP repeat domain-containing protein n=1 Tax=Streptomyces sp. NPDC001678 TaxID=3364599 RepID=UPI0036A3DDA4
MAAIAVGLAAAVTLTVMTAGAVPFPWGMRTTVTTADSGKARAAASESPMFPLFGRKADGNLYDYEPKGDGGVKAAVNLGGGFGDASAIVQANVSENGSGNDLYHRMGDFLYYTAERGNDTKLIGGGWDTYNLLAIVKRGSTVRPELVGRDAAGALWVYETRSDGTLTTRVKIGNSGWNRFDCIGGRGDFTGDGKGDLIARDASGTLYIYPGTGDAAAEAALSTRITVSSGWGDYRILVSTGDNDGDGKPDLIGTDKAGLLWLFKGTGDPKAPFAPRVQIGNGGWGAFNALF